MVPKLGGVVDAFSFHVDRHPGESEGALAGRLSNLRHEVDSAPANVAFIGPNWSITASPGVSGADSYCRAAAADAGLPGASSYVAWLAGASRVADLGWVRADGKPIAASLADLIPDGGRSTNFKYLINNTLFGELPPNSAFGVVTTGTQASGAIGNTCLSWGGGGTGSQATYGDSYYGSAKWTARGTTGQCATTSDKVYCFGNFDGGLYRAPTVPPGARRAFITTATGSGGTSLQAMDALCAAEAADAGLSGTFLGMRSANSGSAASRFNLDGGGWFRTDGVAFYPWAPALASSSEYPKAPLSVTARGLPTASACVWTGFVLDPTGIASNCSDWTLDAGATGYAVAESAYRLLNSTGFACANDCRFFCLEQ